ncbi:MAG: xanthine dehydrogenase small subunit [Gemmatimonadetes bacterium]|nr:xanthine dehydrogenase small subunit [Gemmatimonadota bacterium]
MSCIRFHLNGKTVEESRARPSITLLDYLRVHLGLYGTKEGCAEGDCGACTVVIGDPGAPGGPVYRAVNSCLLLLGEAHGRHVITVEGLAEGEVLHPVQEALVRHGGSQCGYCTPGVVMSLFEAAHRADFDRPWKLADQISGNLCRCTGYGPIRDAAKEVAGCQPPDRYAVLLSDGPAGPGESFRYTGEGQEFVRPRRLEDLWDALDSDARCAVAGGTTDLVLDAKQPARTIGRLVSLSGIEELRGVEKGERRWSIGAMTPLAELEEAAEEGLPMLASMLRYFGSRQIKNLGTVGGNLCTASPVGDLAPCFLALGASVILASRGGRREISIDRFFTGYRETALQPREIVASVAVPVPRENEIGAAFKVCKRRELDIATVSAAFLIELGNEGKISGARIAFGGMAATPSRAPSVEATLLGSEPSSASFAAAAAAIDSDFEPIGDHRGSASYRGALARNLVLEFGDSIEMRGGEAK